MFTPRREVVLDGELSLNLHMDGEVGIVTKVVEHDLPAYTGETTVKPDFTGTVLMTANKVMMNNVTVEPIEVQTVGNLSGGESFKASLSLALGLSDTVSQNIGGIQMDALFIDEGFGTLDRKSIDNALDILMGLSNTNKLVGVISHREELIESIPQQIHVTKTKDGSKIEIETGI